MSKTRNNMRKTRTSRKSRRMKKNVSRKRKFRGGCGTCLAGLGGAQNGGSQRGGQCPCMMVAGSRTRCRSRNGGKGCGCGKIKLPNFFKGGSAPFVGAPWTANTNTWGSTNHFSNNTLNKDPQYIQIQERDNATVPPHSAFSAVKTGGRKTRRLRQRGGFNLIPQDIINLGRNVNYGIGSAYNAVRGFPTPVNPLPYKDQMMKRV